MRISVLSKDPGYRKDAWKYRPYLNGQKIDQVFTADEEDGVLWRYKKDANGRFIVNYATEEIETECLHGNVELRLIDEAVK